MNLYNFNSAYSQLRELYGIELNPDQFETLGMIAWEKIGNKQFTLVQDIFEVQENGLVFLPCDVDTIEAVFIGNADHQKTSNAQNSPIPVNQYVEEYIELRKSDNKNPLYRPGTYVKYRQVDARTIQTQKKDGFVAVLYKTVILDEDGLPQLNHKEVDAIAAYCAYAHSFKKANQTKDQGMFQMSQVLKQEWLKLCDHARTPMSMSQNDFDALGDVRYSWDRKSYKKSFKPVR